MVDVLYDVNTDDAYGKLKRVERVKRAILAHLARERALNVLDVDGNRRQPHGG